MSITEEEEYNFIEKEDLEEEKEHEVPEVKGVLNTTKTSEVRNKKRLKSQLNKKVAPLMKDMQGVNNEILWEMEEILEDIIERNGSYSESHEEALNNLADIIAYHRVIDENIDSIKEIVDNNILPAIAYNSTVQIYGYSDRIGEENYNKKLALQRARNVEKYIRSKAKDAKFEVYGIGESIQPYDNDLTIGRQLSRTVQIYVITPKEK